jgi:hypothetical protein
MKSGCNYRSTNKSNDRYNNLSYESAWGLYLPFHRHAPFPKLKKYVQADTLYVKKCPSFLPAIFNNRQNSWLMREENNAVCQNTNYVIAEKN